MKDHFSSTYLPIRFLNSGTQNSHAKIYIKSKSNLKKPTNQNSREECTYLVESSTYIFLLINWWKVVVVSCSDWHSRKGHLWCLFTSGCSCSWEALEEKARTGRRTQSYRSIKGNLVLFLVSFLIHTLVHNLFFIDPAGVLKLFTCSMREVR